MRSIISSDQVSTKGVALVRIVIGILLVFHGSQAFNQQEMASYGPWMADLGVPFPLQAAYVGKALELLGGICLIVGLYIRIATALLMITFLFITLVMGGGKILTDGQHPFLFFLFSMLFFFSGDSGISIKRLWR